jgi:hypothetical protein
MHTYNKEFKKNFSSLNQQNRKTQKIQIAQKLIKLFKNYKKLPKSTENSKPQPLLLNPLTLLNQTTTQNKQQQTGEE